MEICVARITGFLLQLSCSAFFYLLQVWHNIKRLKKRFQTIIAIKQTIQIPTIIIIEIFSPIPGWLLIHRGVTCRPAKRRQFSWRRPHRRCSRRTCWQWHINTSHFGGCICFKESVCYAFR